MDSLTGTHGNSHLYRVSQNKCTGVAGILFYVPEGSDYLKHLVIRLFAISCVRNTYTSELDLFKTCPNGIQSFRLLVISTPSQFDPYFSQLDAPNFLLQKMVVLSSFIFPVSNIEQKNKKKKPSVVVNISILFFCSEY